MNAPIQYIMERVGCEFDAEEAKHHFKDLDDDSVESVRLKVLEIFEAIALDTYVIHYRPTPYSYKVSKRIMEEMQVIQEWKKIRKTRTMKRDAKILYVAEVLGFTRKNVRDTLERVKAGEGYAPRLVKADI
ncbi:MAG: hypothetical protein KAT14_03625 [Candidatus Marinimicrobia bacterium]|nr:hypothetical protein [Candidatus Neomarinimicrobiota bacterium]